MSKRKKKGGSGGVTENINNKDEALVFVAKVSSLPRSSWIEKGRRGKDNENVELPRVLVRELAEKALQFYLVLEKLPYNPFCNCGQVEQLLTAAVGELPPGETADLLEQIIFTYCPSCGQPFDKEERL
jgi:hypothetical protein